MRLENSVSLGCLIIQMLIETYPRKLHVMLSLTQALSKKIHVRQVPYDAS